VVANRAYFTYRHFHNATAMDVFSYSPFGAAGTVDIDRYTFGFERMIGDRLSVEFRLPINTQLGSDLLFTHDNSGSSIPLSDKDTDLGNIAVVIKRSLHRTRCFDLSGGFGVNTPTAPDVRLRGAIHVDDYGLYDINNPGRLLYTVDRVDVDVDGQIENATVNLQPFLAVRWTPTEDFFTHGFLQVDVPLNKSDVALAMDTYLRDPAVTGGEYVGSTYESGGISQQTLLRLNLGAGRWVYRSPYGRFVDRIGAMLEVHYTETLQDADIVGTTLPVPTAQLPGIRSNLDLRVGNMRNRVGVVNMVAGVPIQMGRTMVHNGFIFPVSGGDNRGFDFEYSLMIDRRF